VSPILVRPVREQLEHDRIIRLLPGRYRRKFEVGINPGSEQVASVGAGANAVFPDAVLYSTERSKKVVGVVEVETGESVNPLEAMSQWAHFGRLKVPFHLYVPSPALDVARRLAEIHGVRLSELWTYDNIGDQVRFTLIHKAPEPAARPAAASTRQPAERKTMSRPSAAPRAAKSKRPAAGSRAAAPAARRKTAQARPAPARSAKRAAPAAKKTAGKRARPAQKRR
jgi:hypothetical protein